MIKIVGRSDVGSLVLRDLQPVIEKLEIAKKAADIVDMCLAYSTMFVDHEAVAARRLMMRTIRERFQPEPVSYTLYCGYKRDHGSILFFTDVLPHEDPGFFLYKKGTSPTARPPDRKVYDVATLSVVLAGAGTLNLHPSGSATKSIELSVGDIYLFDQAIPHSFKGGRDLNVHLSASILRDLAEATPQLEE